MNRDERERQEQRNERMEKIGWMITRHGGSMTALGAMLIGDAKFAPGDAEQNAETSYGVLSSIMQDLQKLRLGLAPIAGIDLAKPEIKH